MLERMKYKEITLKLLTLSSKGKYFYRMLFSKMDVKGAESWYNAKCRFLTQMTDDKCNFDVSLW